MQFCRTATAFPKRKVVQLIAFEIKSIDATQHNREEVNIPINCLHRYDVTVYTIDRHTSCQQLYAQPVTISSQQQFPI